MALTALEISEMNYLEAPGKTERERERTRFYIRSHVQYAREKADWELDPK